MTQQEGSYDPINNPSHYTDGGYETIDFIEKMQLGYHLGNVVKYISRAGKKNPDPIEDLKKAMWYLNRLMKIDVWESTIVSEANRQEVIRYCEAKGIKDNRWIDLFLAICNNDLSKAHTRLSLIIHIETL